MSVWTTKSEWMWEEMVQLRCGVSRKLCRLRGLEDHAIAQRWAMMDREGERDAGVGLVASARQKRVYTKFCVLMGFDVR